MPLSYSSQQGSCNRRPASTSCRRCEHPERVQHDLDPYAVTAINNSPGTRQQQGRAISNHSTKPHLAAGSSRPWSFPAVAISSWLCPDPDAPRTPPNARRTPVLRIRPCRDLEQRPERDAGRRWLDPSPIGANSSTRSLSGHSILSVLEGRAGKLRVLLHSASYS